MCNKHYDTVTYVTAGIDCTYVCETHALCAPGQGQQYRLLESVSAVSSYICLGRAMTFLEFSSNIAVAANRNYVLKGTVQVSEAPPSEDMAAIFPWTYGIALCISAISINSGVAASWSQKSDFAFAVWWQNVLSYLELTSHHPAVLGIYFCCER